MFSRLLRSQAAIRRLAVRPFSTQTCPASNLFTDIKANAGKSIFYQRAPMYLAPNRGPLQAAILDWSGTAADKFVMAPAVGFVAAFYCMEGFVLTMAEARQPMGLLKNLHIDALLKLPSVSARWKAKFHRLPNDRDSKKIFEHFLVEQRKCLVQYAGMIPGAGEAVKIMRDKYNLKIGGTTGFQREFVDTLAACTTAENDGVALMDVCVAGDEAPMPRSWPFMLFKNMELLRIQNVLNVLKVDDTTSGVGEGLNAGTWTCGLSHTSNYMQIDEIDENGVPVNVSPMELARRGAASRELLLKSGAHYVVDDIRGVPAVVADINRRLANGERPL
jgi:phosphonoacetaldehyde hydrolase